MSIAKLRRTGAPVAVVTLASFVLSYAPHRLARAEEREARIESQGADVPSPKEQAVAIAVATARESVETATAPAADDVARVASTESAVSRSATTGGTAPIVDAVLTEGNVTGVSSQAIAVPQGAGKVQGMGESFSAQMSTGLATFSVPFTLPKARGGAQPELGLSYSSASGRGAAGIGWDVGVPYISRQTDHGLPNYDVPATGQWTTASGAYVQDRFIFNGGQELIPICLVSGTSCSNALPGEIMPSWANGWFYFRPRVEGSYLRFFWSPDYRTWRVQAKSGETMEIGAPLDGDATPGFLEADPQNASHVFRWNLSRRYDAQGNANASPPAPVNVVKYLYLVDGGMAYLQHIYDTPPAGGSITDVTQFAHHTYLSYASSPDINVSYRRGWPVTRDLRLTRIDVASVPFLAPVPRHVVRRYSLSYDTTFTRVSQLTEVQEQGRCGTTETAAAAETGELLPPTPSCPVLPPMTFGYQHVDPTSSFEGFETLNQTVETMANSPRHTLDEALADLFDVNADGLPDLLVTAPGQYNYGSNDAVFFNGSGGVPNSFGSFVPMAVTGIPGEDTNIIRLDNPNLAAFDIDGDGIINLVHMPQVKTYSVYSPSQSPLAWVGTPVTTASQQSPKINFQHDSGTLPPTRVMDVNGDGLVDAVFSSGTEYQTFFAGGLYPGGNGQFGTASWTSATSSAIGNDPVTSCLPWSATPALLSDPDVRIADMNGDGLPDIVRARPGDVRYWPGRGNGFWGTSGDPTSCPGGTFGQNQDIAMTASPQFGVVDTTEALLLDDVNGDGLDDLVKIEFNAARIFLNVNGTSWTDSFVIENTPPLTIAGDRARLTDINGSGTRDLFWGNAYNYQYIDLQGGQRPWVLTHVDNGLGKTTDLTYSTSTAQMLAAEAAGTPWVSKAPMPVHVVSSATERDNLTVAGQAPTAYVTNYTYRDAVYDGKQREFRGFRSATARRAGDANSPSSTASSTFLLGDCADDEPPPAGVSSRCAFDGRWTDNVREALKGLPLVNETVDDNGNYLTTSHQTYRLRKLYTGLDGREVRVAFVSQADTWAYDNAPFTPAAAAESPAPADVELELTPGSVSQDVVAAAGVTLRATAGRVQTHSASVADAFGNGTDEVASGCVAGCAVADDVITNHATPAIPPGDTSGWLWRTIESHVEGTSDGAPRDQTFTTYDATGNPVHTQAALAGTFQLDRFHALPGATTAPAPNSASVDRTIDVSWVRYDAFGNATDSAAPNSRCRHVTFASDYADLATSETVFVGGAGGSCATGSGTAGVVPLRAYAGYDRGFDAVVSVLDLHNEPTAIAYDGLGRLSSLTKPSAAGAVPSAFPSILVSYDLATASRPYSIIYTQTFDGPSEAMPSYRRTYAFVDGMGRALLTLEQADPSEGDGGPWILGAVTVRDAKGATSRKYLASFWGGSDPTTYAVAQAPPTAYERQRYDAFGRPMQEFALDGTVILQSAYHALSTDKWDAADLQPGPHQGTYASAAQDGHGRAVSMTERNHTGNAIELRTTTTKYLSTGEPVVITRQRGSDQVVRWLTYDTLGRMVLNVEPNTAANFSADPTTATAAPSPMKAWRYAYNDNGELVGTSDARGCGSNYLYDTGGRIVVEDYSPCVATQQTYSTPNPTTGDGAEVFYVYDGPDPAVPLQVNRGTANECDVNAALLLGRLVSVSDRASRSVSSVDGRGRVVCTARQIATPGEPNVALALRYAPTWYSQTAAYDGADRAVQSSTGAVALALTNGQSFVSTAYSKRGTIASVGSSYASLVSSVTRDADGSVLGIVYGDAAETTTSMSYDARRRLSTLQTSRGAAALWSQQPAAYFPAPNPSGPPTTFQRLLADYDIHYDAVDNPVEVDDWRDPSEWPAGAQPVTRKMQYDDLYRLSRIDYQYASGGDAWTDPFDAEDAGTPTEQDPRRAAPSPHLSFTQRVLSQTFQYDWLGNTSATNDDVGGFYDRSIGTITNGSPNAGPDQVRSATGGAAPRDGSLTTSYDAAGELVGLSIVRNAGAPCLPTAASCSQFFAYDWDEVGRLARARRWDGSALGTASGPLPAAATSVDLQYSYDGSDNRIVKEATDSQGNHLYTLYVFGSLDLRRTTFDGADYDRNTETEVPYLFANGVRLARLHYAANDVPTLTSGNLHVLLELQDQLGSTTIVLDQATGELVEDGTYEAYGATESDYRPERWDSYREDYRFTGKEEDVEVGLQYFGKRYYAPGLGRWISADPLTVHDLSADPNGYAYVHRSPLMLTDKLGLADPKLQPPPWYQLVSSSNASETYYDPATQHTQQVYATLTIVGHVDPAPRSAGDEIKDVGVGLGNAGKNFLLDVLEGEALSEFGTEQTHAETQAQIESMRPPPPKNDAQFIGQVIVPVVGAGVTGGGVEALSATRMSTADAELVETYLDNASQARAAEPIQPPEPTTTPAAVSDTSLTALRPASQQPTGGGGVVLRDGQGATPAEMAASKGGPTGGSRVGQDAARQQALNDTPAGQPYTCWRCGHTSTNPADMHLGHRNVPASEGGNLSPVNVCLEGAACNLGAGSRGAPNPGRSCAARGGCGAPYKR